MCVCVPRLTRPTNPSRGSEIGVDWLIKKYLINVPYGFLKFILIVEIPNLKGIRVINVIK